jgi:hypothetical protein
MKPTPSRVTLNLALLGVLGAVAALCSQPATAGYIAYTNAVTAVRGTAASGYADLQPNSSQTPNGNQISSGQFNTTATSTNAAQNADGSAINGKRAEAYAQADLSTGKLRASVATYNTRSTHVSVASVLAASFAEFGDSFQVRSASNGLFNWSGGDQVSMNVHLDGDLLNRAVGELSGLLSASVYLEIWAPGSIGSDTPQVRNGEAMGGAYWNIQQRFDGSWRYTAQPFSGFGLTPLVTIDPQPRQGFYDLGARFNPGGDFDWKLSLQLFSRLSTGVGTQVANFANTATLTYVAPAGAITTSSSGVFPGTTHTVPVPSTAALVVLGAALMSWRRRPGA